MTTSRLLRVLDVLRSTSPRPNRCAPRPHTPSRPSEAASGSRLAAIIERMHPLGPQNLARRRRSVAMLFGTFLVLVPSLCTATVRAPGHHDGAALGHHHDGGASGHRPAGGAPGQHRAGIDVSAHAHWSAAEQASEHHGAHACCAIATHKPPRKDNLAAPASIATPALGARTVVSPLAGPFRGQRGVEPPPGTPGLAATSVPLRR